MTKIDVQIANVMKNKVEKALSTAIRCVSLQAYAEITANTPVKTGRARNNWNVDVNNIDATTTEDAGSFDGIKAMIKTGNIKDKDTVYISNNLPYINRLNDGYSKQAPSNFIERAVEFAKRKGMDLFRREFDK